ncbi:hypothetical protein BO78DRAFT_382335 [Aspergillus sclerotiicarbonarius CBS 121057]|uniref:Uncharacterized protein n=1 Tax=Aspergillus sclerotiicarbonarius (strain CBS 121057 / IBT 28362) TaxID=1448318 RepID=A0A319FNA8_ASPSB|nr:hypothetical protein BO78DRAFT_382335 [Aspergillus sclerotiicarbonarius CBS 121057]
MSSSQVPDAAFLERYRLSRLTPVELREETWGWVIYRTTYQSDTAFQRTIEIITSWIKKDVYKDFEHGFSQDSDHTPNHQLWARHQLTIFEDPETLDGASIDTVRGQFEEWGESLGIKDRWNKYRVCMMIDQETVERLSRVVRAEEYTEPLGGGPDGLDVWYVPVIEAFPDLEEGNEDYQG